MNGPPVGLPVDSMPPAMASVLNWFQDNVNRLERGYDDMVVRVAQIDRELDQRNAELEASLAEQSLMRTRLGSLLESLHDGVLMIDPSGIIVMFNARAGSVLGLDPHATIAKPFAEVFDPASEFGSAILRTLHDGAPIRDFEALWMRHETSPVPLGISTATVRDPENRLLGAVATFSDLSHLKQMERELSQTRTLAALGEMAATVAHEIRNPLGGIGGFAALLERDLDFADPRRKLVSRIIEGVASLNKIVSNLLVYTRPMETSSRPVDVAEWLGELAAWAELEAGAQTEGAVTAGTDISEEVTTATFDPEKMQQVLLNLILNAIQAMPEGGRLRLGARMVPGLLICSVEDSGRGIEPDHLQDIFNPFFTTRENGTGLGLAIVRKIVELHGGSIFVQSELGRGTRFEIHLPQATED